MRDVDYDSYLGHWYDKIHDFKLAAMKTFAEEEKMVAVAQAINQFEVIHLNLNLGWMEMSNGGSLQKTSQGFIRTMSALSDLPEAIALFWSGEFDQQKMLIVAFDVYNMGTDIFWSNLGLWNDARLKMKELSKVHDYSSAGEVFARAFITSIGGPVLDFPEADDMVTSIVKPVEVEAASITAGVLYGITKRDNLDDLATCFYGADEFVFDVVKGFQMLTSRTFAGLINGATLLLETVMYIPQDLINCYRSAEDAKALEQWAAIFVKPKELTATIEYNMKHHFPAISVELAKAKKLYAEENYFNFGEALGEIIVIATTPVPAE